MWDVFLHLSLGVNPRVAAQQSWPWEYDSEGLRFGRKEGTVTIVILGKVRERKSTIYH